MFDFKSVSKAVSVKDAANFYGIKVSKNGMCNCIFHKDRHPSMKVDSRYYCFSCQRTGDVIDFVSQLFSINTKEAYLKLAHDFGINNSPYQIDKPAIKSKQPAYNRNTYDLIYYCCTEMLIQSQKAIRENEPASINDEWSDTFCLAIESATIAEHYLSILDHGTDLEKQNLIKKLGG